MICNHNGRFEDSSFNNKDFWIVVSRGGLTCGPNMRGKFGTPAAVSAALTMAAITASAYGLNPRVIVNNNKEKPSTEKPIQVDKPGEKLPMLHFYQTALFIHPNAACPRSKSEVNTMPSILYTPTFNITKPNIFWLNGLHDIRWGRRYLVEDERNFAFCLPPEGHKQLVLILFFLQTCSIFKASAYANLNFDVQYTFLVPLDTFENIVQYFDNSKIFLSFR